MVWRAGGGESRGICLFSFISPLRDRVENKRRGGGIRCTGVIVSLVYPIEAEVATVPARIYLSHYRHSFAREFVY